MQNVTLTDIGVVRKENQDAVKVESADNVTLAVLCDGMGGHPGGRQAARITVDTFVKQFRRHPTRCVRHPHNWVRQTLQLARNQMEKAARHDPNLQDMGTTFTCVLFNQNSHEAYVYNIGDSRTYVFGPRLQQVTVDQNLLNYYVYEKKMALSKAARVYGAAALTSALGPQKQANVDSFHIKRTSTTKFFMLTSDGIHDFLEPAFLSDALSDPTTTLQEKAKHLVARALKNGSTDNLTVAIVKVS